MKHIYTFGGTLVIFLFSSIVAHGQAMELRTERGTTSHDGRVKLIWTNAGADAVYTLEQARDKTFSTNKKIYEGPDRASFVSGLPDGRYYFRVRSESHSWSPALELHVRHHSLSLAFSLFGVGALVFILTVLVVLRGAARTKNHHA